MDEILVRPLVAEDLDAIVAVYRSMAEHYAALEPGRYRVPDADAVRARFEWLHEDAANLHVVAEVGGRVVGSLDAFLEDVIGPGSQRRPMASATIGVAVLDGHRGRGIGTALLAAAERWAREHGLDELRLEVAAENDGARRLYERLGYAPMTETLARRLR